jgi:hypothetical protein
MKCAWIAAVVLTVNLTLAQEQPPSPPPPKDEPRREQPPPPEGDRPEAKRPPPPGGERPLPPREFAGERAEGRRPMPPLPEGERGGPRPPLPPREGERMRPMPPPDQIQNFEATMHRELGPMMEMAKDFAGPLLKERMEQARRLFQERRFEEGREVLRTTARQLRDMKDLRERDPERFKLQMQIAELDRHSAELGQKVRRAPNEDAKKQAAAELKEVLNKLFDLRQEEREKNVQQIERDLKELRGSLEKRKAKRDEIIKHRFDQLTGKAEMLDW